MSFTTQPEAPVLFSKPPAGAQVLAAACSTQMANAIILIGVTIATSVVAYWRPRSTAKPGGSVIRLGFSQLKQHQRGVAFRTPRMQKMSIEYLFTASRTATPFALLRV